MATLCRVLRKSLLKNSLFQASKCLGIRSFSVDVDDNVSGITSEQKQVRFKTFVVIKTPFVGNHVFSCV